MKLHVVSTGSTMPFGVNTMDNARVANTYTYEDALLFASAPELQAENAILRAEIEGLRARLNPPFHDLDMTSADADLDVMPYAGLTKAEFDQTQDNS